MSWFWMGGPWMWFILAVDLGVSGLIVGTGVLGLATYFLGRWRLAPRVLGVVGLLATTVPMLFGLIGWWRGLAQVEEALAFVDPSQRELLLEVGSAEARVPLWFGLGSAVFLGAAALLALATAIPSGRVPERD